MTGLRTALVTGGGSGIGRAAAVTLAQAGYDVAVTYSANRSGAEHTVALAQEAGVRAFAAHADLADPASMTVAIEGLVGSLGGLDAFVNNAGMQELSPFLETELDSWQRVIAADLTGAFVAGQSAARILRSQGRGGAIVNVTSLHATVPLGNGASYCAAKGGLWALTQVMALELAEYDITVNAIAPGETATRMSGATDGDTNVHRPDVPAGRPGDPDEMAAAIAYLVSPQARFTTGSQLLVDGGLSLMAAIPNQRTMTRSRPEVAHSEFEGGPIVKETADAEA